MALSEKEQQLLAQMEAALAAEDPKLANTLRGSTTRSLHQRNASIAVVGIVAGLALLVAGMSWHWGVSVAGFVLMLVSTVVGLRSWQPVVRPSQRPVAQPDDVVSHPDETWRQRNDDEAV